jgi:hypothetical protein
VGSHPSVESRTLVEGSLEFKVDHRTICDLAAGHLRACLDGLDRLVIRNFDRLRPEGLEGVSVIQVELPHDPGFLNFPRLVEALTPLGKVSGPVLHRGRRGTSVEVGCAAEGRPLIVKVYTDRTGPTLQPVPHLGYTGGSS